MDGDKSHTTIHHGLLPAEIGFPPPLLGPNAVRLPLLGRSEGWVVLAKPAGVLVDPLPGRPGVPSLTTALRQQIQAGKPELSNWAAECVRGVYPLDEEITGPVVLALRENSAAALRNAYGSGFFRFTFRLVAQMDVRLEECVCEAPIAYDSRRGMAIVTPRRGKKARTAFRMLARAGDFSLWEACTDYIRYGQVRLHARELGIRVVGDEAMGGVAAPVASVVNDRRRWNGRDEPYYRLPMVWLHAVALGGTGGTEGWHETFIPPKGVGVFLKRRFNF